MPTRKGHRRKRHNIRLRILSESQSFMDLAERFPDEATCVRYLEAVRWSGGQGCPHCGSVKYYTYVDGMNYKCADCRLRYNVRVGTVFENSKVPLRKWFFAVYVSSSHKKGISSCQLARDIGVTQKTAWFMLHRIRRMMQDISREKLKGIVESDGTLIGGQLKFKKKEQIEELKKKHNSDRLGGNVGKTPVLGIIERGGRVILTVSEETNGKTLKPILRQHIDASARVFTDTFGAYRGIHEYFAEHQTTNHEQGEYVRGEVHNNNIEAVWNHFKRMIFGTYHYISPKHLQSYCFEMMLRYNTRKYQSEFMRFEEVLARSCGRRLRYCELIAPVKKAA